jgi:hypothetical protein
MFVHLTWVPALMFSVLGSNTPPPIVMPTLLVGLQNGRGVGLALGEGLALGDGLAVGDGLAFGVGLGLGEGVGV